MRKFPNLKHFFFPYFPTKIGSEYLNRRAARFDFGFIGSQNSVNAKSLKNAVEFMERASCDFNILVAGAIAKGISKAPHYVNTVPSIELHEFYSSIKWLLVMHPDQSGTCTKLIESLSFGVPVIAPISLLRNIPLNIDPMPMNKNFWSKITLASLDQRYSFEQQSSSFIEYQSAYKLKKLQLIKLLNE